MMMLSAKEISELDMKAFLADLRKRNFSRAGETEVIAIKAADVIEHLLSRVLKPGDDLGNGLVAMPRDSHSPPLYVEAQERAAAKYGLKPGELQWQWREGVRTDPNEVMDAIIDALAMGGIHGWHGSAVSCVAQIVTCQMRRAEKAEAELAAMIEAAKEG
jgi:hypothetical protein